MVVIGAVDDKAIYFLENGTWISIDRQSPRVLSNENYVRVADCVYKVVVPSYDSVSYQIYRRGLDMLFKRAGLAAVHPGLYSLPTKEPYDMVGPYICHTVIGKSAFGYVEAGVKIDSGEPVAIDELGLIRDILDSDREHELEALFAFPVSTRYPFFFHPTDLRLPDLGRNQKMMSSLCHVHIISLPSSHVWCQRRVSG